MDGICFTCPLGFLLLVFILLLSTTNGCVRNTDCGDGRHCCKAHCTTSKIDCSRICFRDQECSRGHLCNQNMCVKCSDRFNCELKSCFNDTHCPTSLRCSNHMCTKKKPPKQNFTLLPFIIIIAVLGFALLVLCYTEGCWKEILIYLKRYFGRYGRIARDEHEADRQDMCESESERGSRHYRHSNKSTVDPNRITGAMSNHTSSENTNLQASRTSSNSNSPNTLRNIQVISHNNQTRTVAVSISRAPLMTSSTSSTCQQERGQNSVNSGCSPTLSANTSHSTSMNPSSLPPNYSSLFNGEDKFEEPPPKYDEVVNNTNTVPVYIEMQAIRPGILSMNPNQETETTV